MKNKVLEKAILNVTFPAYDAKNDCWVMARFRSVKDFKEYMSAFDPKKLLEEYLGEDHYFEKKLKKLMEAAY